MLYFVLPLKFDIVAKRINEFQNIVIASMMIDYDVIIFSQPDITQGLSISYGKWK